MKVKEPLQDDLKRTMMSLEQGKKVVQQFWDDFSAGDFEGAFQLLADDIVLTVQGSHGLSGTYRGKDELRSKVLEPELELIEPLKVTVQELIAEGNTVVCLAAGSTRAKKTGKPYNNQYAMVYRIRNGKIAEIIEYLDTALTETVMFGKTLV